MDGAAAAPASAPAPVSDSASSGPSAAPVSDVAVNPVSDPVAASYDEFEGDGLVGGDSLPGNSPDPTFGDVPEQPAPAPAPAPAAAPAPVQITPAHQQWGEFLGVPPEKVADPAFQPVLRRMAEVMQEVNTLRAQGQQPAAQQQQTQPSVQSDANLANAVTIPAFEWSDPEGVHPDLVKFSEHFRSAVPAAIQKAIDERLAGLAGLEQRLPALDGLITAQVQARHRADAEAFQQALIGLNVPDVIGDGKAGQWNLANCQRIEALAKVLLQNGSAKTIGEAAQKAFRAEFGDHLQKQALSAAASASRQRAAQAVNSPTQRDSGLGTPPGDDAALDYVEQVYREKYGWKGSVDRETAQLLNS